MAAQSRLIKKYPNRRLYDTRTSTYITLADIKELVLGHEEFQVVDAKSGEDLTRAILLQVILEEEAGGAPMFSSELLSQMIRFYGNAMQGMMGTYIGDNIRSFTEVQAKLKEHGIKAVNYGVVTIPKEAAAARKLFQFAKGLGLYAITTESTDAIDTFEPLVKEFDIRVAFHNHAQQPKNPAYKVWDPKWVADLVRNRDSRIGACADIGHWQTSGIKAVDGLRMLEGRVISLHAKEREQLGHGQRDMIFGTGSTDMGAVLAELRRQKFDGNISCEYEFNWDHSVPDVAQCIGFVRGWSAGNR
jgi:polyhydroxyalkanoate synthesis repressor PhaR